MMELSFTPEWHSTHAGGHVGLLLVGAVDNSRRPTPLDAQKTQLEAAIRERLGGLDRPALLGQSPVLSAYKRYYRRFNKTYHVQLQLESVAFKGRSLPAVNPLVDACFAAELETHLLTASHDADLLQPPLAMDVSSANAVLPMLSGKDQQLKAGDMAMVDAGGVVCTIIYGQDRRSPVTPETRRVLYVTYAPAGVSRAAVENHHSTLLRNVHLFAPHAAVALDQIESAGGQAGGAFEETST
jgi:DNA/RNA-binding domain of Phe-tRNA-synthetase-like protein